MERITAPSSLQETQQETQVALETPSAQEAQAVLGIEANPPCQDFHPWHRWPLLPWTAGLATGLSLDASVPLVWVIGLAILFYGWSRLSRPWALPIGAFLLATGFGSWMDPTMREVESISSEHPATVQGRVISHPERVDPDLMRFMLSVGSVEQRSRVWTGELEIWIQAPAEVWNRVKLGQRLAMKGYLRASIPPANLRPVRPGPLRLSLKSARFLEVLEVEPRWLRPGIELREALSEMFDRWPGRGSGLVRALILGDRSRLPKAWMRTARAMGSVHLLAVSGLHVGILAFFVYGISAPLGRRTRYGVACTALLIYWLVVGPKAAISRAVLMALWVLASLALRRPPQTVNLLAGSTGVLLALQPSWISDLGFQLSVTATLALVTVMPWLARRWLRLLPKSLAGSPFPKVLIWSVAASVSAQLATGPMLWPLTGLVHPYAAFVDLLAIPWLITTLVAAWMTTIGLGLVLWFWPGSFDIAVEIASPVMDRLAFPISHLAMAEPICMGYPIAVDAAGALGIVICCFAILAFGWRGLGLLILGLVCSGTGVGTPSGPGLSAGPTLLEQGDGPWQAIFIDVGQGEAVLLRSPGQEILVDGGGWRRGDLGARVLVPLLADLGIRRLDAIAITHADIDHCGGVADLRSYLPVDEIWAAPGWGGSGCLTEVVARPGSRWRVIYGGHEWAQGGWRFEVLWPRAGDRRAGNARSLVLRATAGGRSVLLTGDLEASGERRLLADPERLRADILKAPHHGSKTSSSLPFLRAVAPRMAVVSAGWRNRYGHPHVTVMDRLRSEGIAVLRTDEQGLVRFVWKGRASQELEPPGLLRPWSVDLPSAPVANRPRG